MPTESDMNSAANSTPTIRPTSAGSTPPISNGTIITGATAISKTGVRGVSWNKQHQKYEVNVQYRGVKYHGGYFDTIAEAEVAAIELRTELFTHNDADFQ